MKVLRCPHPGFTALAFALALSPSPGRAATNTITTIDSDGVTGYTAIAFGTGFRPVIAYQAGAAGLRVARCANLLCTGSAGIVTPDTTPWAGAFAAIAIGSDGLPVVRYLAGNAVKVLHCGNADCSATNTVTQVGTTEASYFAGYGGLVIGSDGLPALTFVDATRQIVLLHCGNVSCSAGNASTVLDDGENAGALALDAHGHLIAAFLGDSWDFVHCGNSTCTSGNTLGLVDPEGPPGFGYRSIAATTADAPLVVMNKSYDPDPSILLAAPCVDETCSYLAGTGWPIALDTLGTGDPGPAALTIDADGRPVLSYWQDATDDLRFARCWDSQCTSGGWEVTVDAAGSVGRDSAIVIGSDDLPVISYLDSGNGDLKVLHCGSTGCNEVFVGPFEGGDLQGWSTVVQ